MWQRCIFLIGLGLCCLQALAHQGDITQAELRISQHQNFTLELKVNYLHLFAELLEYEKLDQQALTQLNQMDDSQLNDIISQFNHQFSREFSLTSANGSAVDFKLQSLMSHQLKKMLKQQALFGRSDIKSLTIGGLLPLNSGYMEIDFPDFIGTVKLRRIEENRFLLPPGMTSTQIWSNPSAHVYQAASWHNFIGYVKSGFIHIVPLGLDHILFMLGLFLLGRSWNVLLLQLSIFTVAHSITLALASYGWQPVPNYIVEPLIAVSIVWVALENLLAKKQPRFRVVVIFAFGLLHGLGFASVFLDAMPMNDTIVSQLIGFNLGVEFGQILVVGLAFIATYWFKQQASYRQWVVVPGSTIIACIAGFWTIQRLLLI